MGSGKHKGQGLVMKGLFYSIMIALFIIPILAMIVFYSQTAFPQNIAASIRADEMQYFSGSIEEDLARFLQINGKRALIATTNVSISSETGLDNASLRLTEVIENGTLYGNKIFADQRNLSEWEKNISNIASRSGFGIDLKVTSLNVVQNDSFSILFNATLYVNISDATAEMGILKNITVSEAITIEGIEDPLYPIKTNGNIFRSITKSPASPFNKITTSDLTNLTSDIKNSYYHNSTNGPSFLDRLEGKTTNHYQPYGLESFVYLPDLISAGLPVYSQLSDLDYQYWTSKNGCLLNESFQTDPVYHWFRMCKNNAYVENDLLNTTISCDC